MTSPETVSDAARLLTEDHADLDELLPEIFAALDARDLRAAYARLDRFWAGLAVHIRAEHLRLFPAVLGAAAESPEAHDDAGLSQEDARQLIACLYADHDFFMRELARVVKLLRALLPVAADDEATTGQLEEVRRTLTTLSRRLTEHNRLEETYVYRWSTESLSAAEQVRLTEDVRRELENIPPRFQATRHPGAAEVKAS